MYFTGNDDYQNFIVFASILSSLTLDNKKNVTNCISTGISPEKIKPFDTNFEPSMSNFANGRVTLQFNSFDLVQKRSSSLYGNFILNLCIAYELNNWPRNPSNNFPLKNSLLYSQISNIRN